MTLGRNEPMMHRTAKLSTFEAYLESGGDTAEECALQKAVRHETVSRFPFAVMLELSYPELDFANRWCWQNFGPGHGECFQKYSEYRVCGIDESHCHHGSWTNCWFVKTGYDFGFSEWYFEAQPDCDLFLAFVPSINWGENFPK